MAYVTGTAADLAALRTALISACTANGWTLAGDVVHKGGVFTRLQVVGGYLEVLGGTGIDGSNALTGAGPAVSKIGPCASLGFAFPMTYAVFLHEAPNEVYLVANYNVEYYQFLAFGVSSVAGLAGTGGWYAASMQAAAAASTLVALEPEMGTGISSAYFSSALFTTQIGVDENSFMHHGMNAVAGGWSSKATENTVSSANASLRALLPSAWNSESILLPASAYLTRASAKVSLVLDLGHARWTRVDNYSPGQIVTLGADRWKVFPWFRKNSAVRDGGTSISHSGTMGWAVRYDGA